MSSANVCLDCGVSLEDRHYNTKRCTNCHKKRKANKRRLKNNKTKKTRFCKCGKDISHKNSQSTRCSSCQKEHRKKLARLISKKHYEKTKGYKNPPDKPRYCLECKTDITDYYYNCKRCDSCQKKHRKKHAENYYLSNKDTISLKNRTVRKDRIKKYSADYYAKHQSNILERKRNNWQDYIDRENIIREHLGLPPLGEGYVKEGEMKAYLDKIFLSEKYYDNKFWICADNTLVNKGNIYGGLQLDRYYPNLSLAFEYDGQQHFEHQKYFHKTKMEFLKYQERDILTNQMCESANVKLFRIPYHMDLTEKTLRRLIYG